MQRQMPRNFDSRALMHEGRAVDLRAEDAQPEKPPRVKRLRCPDAEERPAESPEHTHDAIARPPRRLDRALLRGVNRFQALVRHAHESPLRSRLETVSLRSRSNTPCSSAGPRPRLDSPTPGRCASFA